MPVVAPLAGLIGLAVTEAVLPGEFERKPEPMAMERTDSVEAFHNAGEDAEALWPVYRFNALAMSALLPEGGRVFDLGSGSAQLLIHLAQLRPDVRIVGTDLSATMLARGRQAIEEAGVEERVVLIEADMTEPPYGDHGQPDLISSVFSLHHLPTEPMLERCIAALAKVQSATGCNVWIFDHARPRHIHTAERFCQLVTPHVSQALKTDSQNSIKAAFSYAELSAHLSRLDGISHARARYIPLYQVHWVDQAALQTHFVKALPAAIDHKHRQRFRAYLSLWSAAIQNLVRGCGRKAVAQTITQEKIEGAKRPLDPQV